MVNRDKICLVMTASTTPVLPMQALHLKDSEKRFEQYKDALEFYLLQTSIKNVVLCDNTQNEGYGKFESMAEGKGKKYEYLSFKGNYDMVMEKGKGYGEGEILQYVLDHSKLLKTCDTFIKVTGRLQILNIDTIMKLCKKNVNYFNTYMDNKRGRMYADTRFFIVNKQIYAEYLKDVYFSVNDNEKFFLEYAVAAKLEGNINFRRFPVAVNIYGQSGSTGMWYEKSHYDLCVETLKCLFYNNVGKTPPTSAMLKNECIWGEEFWERFSYLNNKKIIIYGAGVIGQRFYKAAKPHCNIRLWVDGNYKKKKRVGLKNIYDPCRICRVKTDYVVIAVKDEKSRDEIKENIMELGITSDKIVYVE